MSLYSYAIEFYAALHDVAKVSHYKNRLKVLLSRREVLKVIRNPGASHSTSVSEKKEKLSKRQKVLANAYHAESMKDIRLRELAIKDHNKSSRAISVKAKDNISLQNRKLEERIKRRYKGK